jgi:uncharacterized membrane protein
MAGAWLAAAVIWRFDRWARWELLGFEMEGGMAAMGTIVASMITFIGLVFSILLIAVQFASAQVTPSAVKSSLRDPFTKLALGVFGGTALYGLTIKARITHAFVPQLGLLVGAVLLGLSMIAFLFLIGHTARILRPTMIVARVGAEGRQVLQAMYPRRLAAARETPQEAPASLPGGPGRVVRYTGAPGMVLAVDIEGLVAEAARCDAFIVLVPAVGDFVITNAPLFHVFGGGGAVDDRRLRGAVAVGPERTLEQDPLFAFRILVDIANRALSRAINDPTMAVRVIHQLHQLLDYLSGCELDIGRHRDAAGRLRLEVRTPTWEDYLHLAVDEIRQFGEKSVQVNRRLRAMLEDLLETAPEGRRRAVRQELDVITRAAQRAFPEPEDRARAAVADHQGIGPSGLPLGDLPRPDREPALDAGRRVPAAAEGIGDDQNVIGRRGVSGR